MRWQKTKRLGPITVDLDFDTGRWAIGISWTSRCGIAVGVLPLMVAFRSTYHYYYEWHGIAAVFALRGPGFALGCYPLRWGLGIEWFCGGALRFALLPFLFELRLDREE